MEINQLSMINIFSILVLVLLILTIIFYKYKFSYWKKKRISFISPSLPFGNFGPMIFKKISFGEGLFELYKKGKLLSKKFVGVYAMSFPIMIVMDPEVIKTILVNDFSYFLGRGYYFNESIDPLNGHIVNLSGAKWKKLRAKISPFFTTASMKQMFSTLVESSKQVEDHLKELCSKSEPVNIGDLVQKLTSENTGFCMFGLNKSTKDLNSNITHYTKLYFEKTFITSFGIVLTKIIPFSFELFRFPIIETEITNFFMATFKDMVHSRLQSGQYRNDVINLFIRLKNNESKSMKHNEDKRQNIEDITFEQLAAQAFSIFLGGFESPSSTLTFCAYELAQNNTIQNKLRAEILAVLARHNGGITYEAIAEMTYLDQVLSETLRKYPPFPMLHRQCNRDYVSPEGDFSLEKGNEVWISILGIHRDPEYYADPEVFDPERFNEENKLNRMPFTYLPFGGGPRSCIGIKFGVLQVKVGLVMLLRAYNYSLNLKTPSPLKFSPLGFFLNPRETIWLNVAPV